MKIILNWCDEDTRAEIALDSPYEDNIKAREFIVFPMQVHKICNDTEDKNVFPGSRIIKITTHHFRPTTIVKQTLVTHLIDDAIWDTTNPCKVFLDDTNSTEALANINVTKELITTTTLSMSTVYNKIWYNAHEEYDLWHDVLEIMDGYQEWDDPPTILEDISPNYESSKEHIEPDFYISDRQT